jgi:hypothetical protein
MGIPNSKESTVKAVLFRALVNFVMGFQVNRSDFWFILGGNHFMSNEAPAFRGLNATRKCRSWYSKLFSGG